ncbi:hypothetical protein LWI28_026668 [Acer negundo]|uniref:Uncharacterized protein n=1 Tax=Acer negundo TaxID=4023 RepID=A0AAD5JHU2_ACENE|nr:hypothetical protein LWI28_026668 [Acer negundo]
MEWVELSLSELRTLLNGASWVLIVAKEEEEEEEEEVVCGCRSFYRRDEGDSGALGINQWYSLFPSRGLRRPGHKRACIKDAGLELEAEGDPSDEGGEEDVNVKMLSQMLEVLKVTRAEQANVHAARSEEIKLITHT